ncbi:MAG: hypothetical protein V3V25_04355 [Paracoccaceae bacterium]
MSIFVKPLATVLVLGLSTTALFAQTIVDADGDGLLSYAEMLTALPDLTEETFVAMDTNEDGLIDADELTAAREAGLVPAE